MDLKAVLSHRFEQIEQAYTERDAILYALGVGFATEPLDSGHLRYLFEEGLVTAPTFANTLGFAGLWMAEPKFAIDWPRMLHAEQRMTIHRPVPPAARIIARNRVSGVRDMGARGAMVHEHTDIVDAESGALLATRIASALARNDGGCGDWGDAPAGLERLPETAPDQVLDLATTEMQPLIYRLSGDLNPLHIDPAVAKAAGFPRPILHGLATKGMAGYALLRLFCDFDASRLRSMSVRFTRPVLPGDKLRFEFWGGAPGTIQFRAVVPDQDCAPVLDRCEARIV